MTVPYWVQDAIFYQIFPDRFANGDPNNDPINVQPWGAPPTIHHFQGGDLRGIIQKFDYLLDLGITAIYLNPIFQAASNHRYNTSDYFKIDDKLGSLLDFHALIDLAHRNNVRIILDGVFNHVGRGFFAFNDLLENGEYSAYRDWFHVRHLPIDAYGPGEAYNYAGWWNFKSLPKLNTHNPQVRAYIMRVARYWIERGADGWRLDVPNEINDDDFWAEFRHTVKSVNRDAYIVGEIWTAEPRWVDDKHFDALMNYPVKDALIACMNHHEGVEQFAERVESLFKIYRRDNLYAMYTPLDSHDTARALTLVGGRLDKLKLAFSYIFAYPGAPAIYYGDEIGLEGGNDPDSRRAFIWDSAHWKGDLRDYIRALAGLRKERPSLRRGDYGRLGLDAAKRWYAFSRVLGEEKTVIVVNLSDSSSGIRVPVQTVWADGRNVRSLIDNRPFTVAGGHIQITLPPWGCAYLG